jgi:hypothetical protein
VKSANQEAVGRKALLDLDTIVSPDTLTPIVAQKLNFIHRRKAGRPGIMRQILDLVFRMAEQNACWGYTRMQGALSNLNFRVGRGTIADVLKRNVIEPSLERRKHEVIDLS